jgi:hypothetical protein
MSRRLCSVAVLTLATIGCATQEGYEKVLSSYVGSTEAALLAQWGPPDTFYSSDASTKYLTYSKSQSGYVPGVPPTYQTSCSFGFCTTLPIGGSPGYSYTDTCKTSFKIVGGTITSWRYQGSACRA